jgi:hypothetical protein
VLCPNSIQQPLIVRVAKNPVAKMEGKFIVEFFGLLTVIVSIR